MKYSISITLLLLITLSSCSSYQKALKSDDNTLKARVADTLYQKKKYNKAIRLFEQCITSYRGKPAGERYFYMYSESLYITKDYVNSGYQFERFHAMYPKSTKAQEALYKSAISYSKLSPRYSKDQVDTYKAIDKLQNFLDLYTESSYVEQANEVAQELQDKIEKKFFENAKQFYTIYDYRAALVALENFIQDFPGTKYREDAVFYKLLSQFEYAKNSVDYKKIDRMKEAKEIYEKFIREYPNSNYQEKVKKIVENIEENLENL